MGSIAKYIIEIFVKDITYENYSKEIKTAHFSFIIYYAVFLTIIGRNVFIQHQNNIEAVWKYISLVVLMEYAESANCCYKISRRDEHYRNLLAILDIQDEKLTVFQSLKEIIPQDILKMSGDETKNYVLAELDRWIKFHEEETKE